MRLTGYVYLRVLMLACVLTTAAHATEPETPTATPPSAPVVAAPAPMLIGPRAPAEAIPFIAPNLRLHKKSIGDADRSVQALGDGSSGSMFTVWGYDQPAFLASDGGPAGPMKLKPKPVAITTNARIPEAYAKGRRWADLTEKDLPFRVSRCIIQRASRMPASESRAFYSLIRHIDVKEGNGLAVAIRESSRKLANAGDNRSTLAIQIPEISEIVWQAEAGDPDFQEVWAGIQSRDFCTSSMMKAIYQLFKSKLGRVIQEYRKRVSGAMTGEHGDFEISDSDKRVARGRLAKEGEESVIGFNLAGDAPESFLASAQGEEASAVADTAPPAPPAPLNPAEQAQVEADLEKRWRQGRVDTAAETLAKIYDGTAAGNAYDEMALEAIDKFADYESGKAGSGFDKVDTSYGFVHGRTNRQTVGDMVTVRYPNLDIRNASGPAHSNLGKAMLRANSQAAELAFAAAGFERSKAIKDAVEQGKWNGPVSALDSTEPALVADTLGRDTQAKDAKAEYLLWQTVEAKKQAEGKDLTPVERIAMLGARVEYERRLHKTLADEAAKQSDGREGTTRRNELWSHAGVLLNNISGDLLQTAKLHRQLRTDVLGGADKVKAADQAIVDRQLASEKAEKQFAAYMDGDFKADLRKDLAGLGAYTAAEIDAMLAQIIRRDSRYNGTDFNFHENERHNYVKDSARNSTVDVLRKYRTRYKLEREKRFGKKL